MVSVDKLAETYGRTLLFDYTLLLNYQIYHHIFFAFFSFFLIQNQITSFAPNDFSLFDIHKT